MSRIGAIERLPFTNYIKRRAKLGGKYHNYITNL